MREDRCRSRRAACTHVQAVVAVSARTISPWKYMTKADINELRMSSLA